MKNLEKDILLICKYRYDTEKYETIKDALDAYCRMKFELDTKEEVTYIFYVIYILPGVLNEFLNEKNKGTFVYYITSLNREIFMGSKDNDYYRILFTRITDWLRSLQVKDENGWIIDISEYQEDENGIMIHI